MARFRQQLLAWTAALSLAAADAWGAVEINDLQVTNVGTTTFTVVWTTSEVSTPGLEVYSDAGGANLITPSLGLDYYPISEGNPAVVNDAGARAARRALELLAIARRVVVVRVTGVSPGTAYFVRPRTFGPNGADNGTGAIPLRAVTTAQFTSLVVDGRLLRIRFPGFAGEGMIALVQGPAGTTALSAIMGDGTAADSAVLPLTDLLNTTSGTNALFDTPQQIVIRVLGSGAPAGTFTPTVDFASTFRAAKLEAVDVTITSPSPIFITQPLNRTEQVGATAAFSAAASGTPAPTYQWQRQAAGGGVWGNLAESAVYVGVTTGTLQVKNVTLAMTDDKFRCIATNGVLPDATSEAATLTVTTAPVANTAPSITTQPANASANAGGNATLAVVATGVPAPTYQWKKGGIDVSGATSASLTLSNVTLADAGSYTVVVTNTIDTVTSNPAAVTVYVAPVITTPPVSRTVLAGQSASFGVVATGTPEPGYQWKRNGINIPGATTSSLTLSGLTSADDATITVEVSNAVAGGLGGTVTETGVALTVNPLAPFFVATPPLTATAVQGLNFLYGPITINATPATFSATGLPAGLSVDPINGNISGVPAVAGALPATFTIELRVENPPPKVTGFDTRTITLTVNPTPPHITSAVAASGQVNADFSYTIGADNSPTSFGATALPPGLSVNGGTGAITGKPTLAGTFTVTISATNAGGTTSQSLVITISPAPSAPVYAGNLSPAGTQGLTFSFSPAFSGSPTAFAITAGTLPAGLTLNPTTGTITGNPAEVGTFAITLRATNLGGSTEVALQITINPAPAAPVITSANSATTSVGAAFSFTLTASGVPALYTFTANDRPPWLNLDAATGVLSGTPTLGTFTLHVFATNSPAAGVFTQGPESVLIITVDPSPNAPVISGAAVVPGRVGVPLNYQLTTNPPVTSFAITSNAPPAWLSLNPTTGAVTGTPTVAGPVRVVFAATDPVFGQGLGLEVLFDIAPALLAPVVTSGGTVQGQVGQPFQYAITATNGPITGYAMPTGSLPAGLSFHPASGLIDGIPSAATSIPVVVTVTATNAAGTSEANALEIVILSPPATPVITSPLTANGQVASAFTYQITASESPTSYVATDLPGGLTVNPTTGVISGAPTAAGSFAITLRAGNAHGLGAPSTLELIVLSALGAPRIVSAASAAGQVGVVFSYSIVAEPGPILNYNVTGTLPLGLALNTVTGVISGRPAAAGLFDLKLTATNSTGTSLPQPLVIGIRPAIGVPLITSARYDIATVGVPFSYQITASNLPATRPLAPPNSLDAVDLPPGLAVNPAMGVIEGTPTRSGVYGVSLVGTNVSGTGAIRDLIIVVLPAPSAPRITSVRTAAGQAGRPFSYTITATHDPTGFAVEDAPPWMTVNPLSGVIAGTPTAPGTIDVQLLARNGGGTSDPLTLTISISPAAGTPVITSSHTVLGRLGTAFSHATTATPAATSFVATGLPGGLTINPGTGLISGTPTASGHFTVTLTAANALGSGAPTTLTIEIVPSSRLAPGP